MHRLRASALGVLLTLAALAAGVGRAHAVAVSVGTGTGLAGQTVDIDINTASLTGLNVLSLQFDLSFGNTVVTAVNVITPGSLTAAAGWATPSFSVSNVGGTGTIHVSDAGSSPIVGPGSLLKIRFLINPALLNGGSTALNIANVIFNEGSPTVTTTNGSLVVGVTPQIDVTPDAGEIVRGSTLQFTISGSVTNPVAWSTSNNAVATISGTGLLTGLAPGAVTVTATDAAAHSSTTTGTVLVRGMSITPTGSTVVVGGTLQVPITVSSLNGLGIRSGQFVLAYNTAVLGLTGVTTPGGTLLNGWGPVSSATSSAGCTVDFAGSTDLTGSGVLCFLNFHALSPGGTSLGLSSAVFNEVLPALRVNGSAIVSALPVITINPDVVSLLAGQTQQFTISGSPTPPITWSVLDPTLATISPTGLLTAVSGGVTKVRAQDANGAVAVTTSLTIYDMQVTLGTAKGQPGSTVKVSIVSDRLVGGLGIWSMQFSIGWSSASIANGRAHTSGLWGMWGPGAPLSKFYATGSLSCAAAGSAVMGNQGTDLASVLLDISPTATLGQTIPLTLNGLVFNEGLPKPLVVNGSLQVVNTADVDPPPGLAAFSLGASEPNPAREGTRIPFSLPSLASTGPVRLGVFALDGRRVRGLLDGPMGPGPHEVVWDGRDDGGRAVSAGLYFTRLECGAQRATRKLTVVR